MRVRTSRSAWIAALVILPVPTFPIAANSLATATCFGEAATIVGSAWEDITGTDGPDVVVTNGAESVNTGRGNDLLCITKWFDFTGFSTGAGNDRVQVSTPAEKDAWLLVDLGAGSDEFIGGPTDESVVAAHGNNGLGDRDTISTGEGDDDVTTGGASAKGDSIDLGPGQDLLIVKRASASALRVTAVGADNSLFLWNPGAGSASLALDNTTGQLTRDGVLAAEFVGFSAFNVQVGGPLTFVGGASGEELTLAHRPGRDQAAPWPHDISMGAGDDGVDGPMGAPGSRYDGGEGTDTFSLGWQTSLPTRALYFDLMTGELRTTVNEVTTARSATTFEHVDMFNSGPVTLLGTEGPDSLSITQYGEAPGSAVIDGRAGDDVLRGSRGDDDLVGGDGNDSADGGDGQDRCEAETQLSCEL